MPQIRMLNDTKINGRAYKTGDVVELPEKRAKALIASGAAQSAVETRTASPPVRTASRTPYGREGR